VADEALEIDLGDWRGCINHSQKSARCLTWAAFTGQARMGSAAMPVTGRG
jgi:hypothetical protein